MLPSSLEAFFNESGVLRTLDLNKVFFTPKRMFFVEGKDGFVRGGHAHKECQQFLICVSGKIDCFVRDLVLNIEYTRILRPGDTLYLPVKTWSEQKYIGDNSVLCCLCSKDYDEKDYIYGKKL